MAVSEASKEMIWLKNFLKELGKKQVDIALYSDSQSAIYSPCEESCVYLGQSIFS